MSLVEVVAAGVGEQRAPGAIVAVLSRGQDDLDVVAVNVDADALFEIGSVTKLMTAVLVLQHVAEGDLGLDDSVVSFLPELHLDPRSVTGKITIRHLLTHTSGIDCADDFTDTGDADDCLARYVTDAVNGATLLHEPGARWSYSNAGYSLLGRIVEVLDGRVWDDAVVERIFKPLGLSATTTARVDAQRVAVGHRYDPAVDAVIEEHGRMPRSAGPAGNVLASASDIARFAHASFDGEGRLLPPRLVDEMKRPHVEARDARQALAWTSPEPGLYVHGGSTRGFTSFLGAVPELGAIAIVANGPGASSLAIAVRAHLFGEPSATEQQSGGIADIDPSDCVGRYERRHVVQDIVVDRSKLRAETHFWGPLADLFPDPEPVWLEPVGGGRFRASPEPQDTPLSWDFTDQDSRGTPTMLFTNRLHRRTN